MRHSITLALLVLTVGLTPAWANDPGADVIPWSGTDLADQSQVQFPDVLDGRPAVLLFWATWCPYCKAFMPYAGRIQADYAEQGVKLITFNAKERGRGNPTTYIESLSFPLIAIDQADDIAVSYGVEYIPGLLVVDGDGVITYRRGWTELPAGRAVAEQWDGEVRAALDRLLNEPARGDGS